MHFYTKFIENLQKTGCTGTCIPECTRLPKCTFLHNKPCDYYFLILVNYLLTVPLKDLIKYFQCIYLSKIFKFFLPHGKLYRFWIQFF